jgi:RNA polymerase sigma factor (TIGR02999 family)
MTDVTHILQAIEKGEALAVEQLLPVVYQELRLMAAQQLVREKPGQTLQPTALVHEAYLRLVKPTANSATPEFANRRHFFGAAAEAMRRILIDQARRKQLLHRVTVDDVEPAIVTDDRWLHLADALTTLTTSDPTAAQVAQLRLLGGLSIEEAGEMLGMSRATAYREWEFARAWLANQLRDHDPEYSATI